MIIYRHENAIDLLINSGNIPILTAMAILDDILIILALSLLVFFVFNRFKVPAIAGFIITGVMAGPYGFALVKSVGDVRELAEIGVMLLLFTIGIEFSLKSVFQAKRLVLLGGVLQVSITILLGFLAARLLGQPAGRSLFIGFIVSLSSTAIVLKVMQERAELDSPHGMITLGILIFQDIVVVAMLLLSPVLAGASGGIGRPLLIVLLKGTGIIILVLISARWVVPRLLYLVAKTRSRELFLLSVILICLAIAWTASSQGLSLALGAFLAGVTISGSEYKHQALGNIIPFRDVFTSFFFISIGMLLDVGYFLQHPVIILAVFIGVLIVKSLVAGGVPALLGAPVRTSVLTGIALCQIGEFSFILLRNGLDHGLLDADLFNLFLSASLLTMLATPFLIKFSPALADSVMRLPLPGRLKNGLSRAPQSGTAGKKDHLVIIGYGVNGRNVATAARESGIPYVIIEMNPDVVIEEQKKGEPILYGDAVYESVLGNAGVKSARVVIVAINDPAATRRITAVVRQLHAAGYLIVRTRYVKEMEALYRLGADEVIPEEFETSVEIFARVLDRYHIPKDSIEELVSKIRSDGYEMFRSLSEGPFSSGKKGPPGGPDKNRS